ncbi:MAG: hypothetical protein JXA30_02775 [Deltaproteobacteria bacterium]|nr:hypothetical protein [Deltaproteobacteria bacterium]
MNVKILIDSIVRQTTVLIAQLATTGGIRAPLAHIANQVFLDLSRELDAQGVSRKVSADMFGMALRTYLRKIQWLTESATDRGRTLWEAVLDYLSCGQVRTKAQVLKRFCRDEEVLVRGVLHDLTESGLVFSSGTGPNQIFRATTRAEQLQVQIEDSESGLDELIWAFIYREGPLTRRDLDAFVVSRSDSIDQALERLLKSKRIEVQGTDADASYSSRELEVRIDASVGWEAAFFDHYQSMVKTMCQRLSKVNKPTDKKGRIGGSTYTFDIWPGHPLAEQAYSCLARFREQHGALYDKIEKYNADNGIPKKYNQIVVYGGQCIVAQEKTDKGEVY